jgi:hypothetical protein
VPVGEVAGVTIYSCRADSDVDVARFLVVARAERVSFRALDYFDIGVEFHSALSLSDLKTQLRGLGAAFRVMRETLRACPLAQNEFTPRQE